MSESLDNTNLNNKERKNEENTLVPRGRNIKDTFSLHQNPKGLSMKTRKSRNKVTHNIQIEHEGRQKAYFMDTHSEQKNTLHGCGRSK